ncbi:MAG: RICIN domain-containing protein [Muribaculaceae bacterium]|nr:RICIN domain-containing protein [Muribaculaceae bacterium]
MGSDFIQKHGTNLVSEQTRNLPAMLVERNGKKMYAVKMPWGVEGRGEVFIDGFKEVSLPEQGAKTYRISCKKDMGYGIDIQSDKSENGANVMIYKTSQTFEITKLANGYYTIMRNGKCLDISGNPSPVVDGGNIHTWDYVSGDNQQWKFVRNDDGSYTIVSKKDENFALTVDGGTMANSTNLQVNRVDGSDSQKWILEPVNAPEKDLYISDVLTEGVEKVTSMVNGKPVTTFYFEDWKSSFKYNYYIKNPYADKKMDVTITPTNDYHSRFIPASKLNTYFNRLVFNVRPDNGETRTIVRKNMATGETTVIATVQYSGVNGRNYSVTYKNPLATDRYNALRFNTWSATTSGTTSNGTKVDDFFTASTADGGDKAGVYLYYVQEEPEADPVEVPVYAGKATAEIFVDDNAAVGYTLDEINSDTDHHLSTDYSAHVSHDQITDRFYDATKVYMNNREVANIDSKSPYIDVTEELLDNNRYACELVAIWPNQTNTYGTDEVELSFADLDIRVHDLEKSEATFHDHSRYYACLIDAELKGDNITNVSGGLRAWRTINDPDEVFDELLGRGNDFLFQSDMNLAGNQFNFINIGGEPMSYDGHNFTNGVVGSKSRMPMATYLLRGYFKFATPSKVAGKNAAPAQDRYYIVEKELRVDFSNNGVVTSVNNVNGNAQVAAVTYYNLAGVASAQPHDGMNIVVTRYTDGSTSSSKLIK